MFADARPRPSGPARGLDWGANARRDANNPRESLGTRFI
jgi:hypothetical protein